MTANQYAAVLQDLEKGRISRGAFEAWKAGLPTPGNTKRIGHKDAPINIIGGYLLGAKIELHPAQRIGNAMSNTRRPDNDEPKTSHELQRRRSANPELFVGEGNDAISPLPPESPWSGENLTEPTIDRTQDR